MKILLASSRAAPEEDEHSYIQALKKGLESLGHQVDELIFDAFSNHYRLQSDNPRSIPRAKLRDPISRELLMYYDMHYKEIEKWIVSREIDRYTFELAAAYLIEDLRAYDVIHCQDAVASRALARLTPADLPFVTSIHGSLVQELADSGNIPEGDILRRKFVLTEEFYGIMSSDIAIVPERLKQEYVTIRGIPERQLATEPYIIADNDRLLSETLNVYASLRG
ncbi:glycosyltransferase family 4 protein [Paenibacillus thermotolerans]|uniref:glycosyltransferase family 4 protein n=1 Tax=Paenibacillus thermotolerans TaxID=3027807 RepID=UPI002368A563|nr:MULTISPECIES: glycosyltransferase [unclassified Paenibacillus]